MLRIRSDSQPSSLFSVVVLVNASTMMGSDIYLDEYYYNLYDYNVEKTSQEIFLRYFYMIVFPYLLLFGTIGNLVSMVILRRYSHNVWSSCMYIALLLPIDIFELYVECGNDWYTKIYNDEKNLSYDILLLSNAVCKVYSFVYNFVKHESSWIIVAASIELTIAMRYPEKIYKMCTKDRATAIILLISVLLISLNLHFFWTYGLTLPANDPNINVVLCAYINELSDNFRDNIWPTIHLLAHLVFPLLVLIGCMILSIPKLTVRGRRIEEQNALLEKYFLDIKTLHELKLSLIVLCSADVFVKCCRLLHYIIDTLSINEHIELEYEHIDLIKAIVDTLSYIYMSHKFWVFYICCSRFRADIKSMFQTLWRPVSRRYHVTHSRSGTLHNASSANQSWREPEAVSSKGATEADDHSPSV